MASLAVLLAWSSGNALGEIIVSPSKILLRSPESSQQLIVTSTEVSGFAVDVTHLATIRASGTVVRIQDNGLVRPVVEGISELVVSFEGHSVNVPVTVTGLQTPAPVSFRNEVIPILTKSACNSGGCHGKAEGQNGFKLSIFGFDAGSDHAALVKEGRSRRVILSQPEESLLLKKGTSETPHGGGRKIVKGSYRYQRVMRWIKEGANFDATGSTIGKIVRVEVEPTDRVLLAGGRQQLRVTAIDSHGARHCVTGEAEYESNAKSIAETNRDGLVHATDVPGQAAILVRYLGHVAVCRITVPQPDVTFQRPPKSNFIDGHVWDQLAKLGIEPSGLADDAQFLRRVYLDTIGTLPTADEARAFLQDSDKTKRAKLIDRLLDRPEYADYWTMKWLDILRADQLKITPQATVAMQRWLLDSFRTNKPFDKMATDVLLANGNTQVKGPAAFYKILAKPDEASRSISQLLLGVRIECAQCHHHPSERWSQADYTGLAGFFTGVKVKRLPGSGEAITSRGGTDLKHPRTGEVVPAMALGAEPADFAGVSDRRRKLAEWMTSPDNEFFAKAIANRIWAHYLGRGLIEPIDDIRDTNPASNEPLMRALVQHMLEVKFDLKAYTRTLLNSRTYQLTSGTTESNENDVQNFSHASYKAMPAEVLLDAICQTTGVSEKFNGWPEGYRAIQIWDNRMPSYFFRIFGRPARVSVCECERSNQPSIAQSLHLLNSPEIMAKVQHRQGRARKLSISQSSPDEGIEELYLASLSRLPTDRERELMKTAFEGANRRAAVEDILWALLNSKTYIFNH